jgi:hypothetical protein
MSPEMRDIAGLEGRYAVTSDGRVWSCPKKFGREGNLFHQGKWLNQQLDHRGYLRATLPRPDGRWKPTLVHRLVAEAFIPKIDGKDQVNHKNSDKRDNCVSNLEWCTCAENIRHSIDAGTFGRNRRVK